MLAATREGFKVRGGHITDDEDFTLGGYSCKSVTIEKDGVVMYNRVIVVDDRLYQVSFAMDKSTEWLGSV